MKRYHTPYGWWGGHGYWSRPEVMSLIEIVKAGTLDFTLASLLWLAVERKASVIIASEPPMAGKTTLLTALSLLFPPWLEQVYTRGWQEDFSFLQETQPSNTYIMVNEISDHLQVYLWGRGVRRVFEALAQGYSLGTTMHADTPEGVLEQLLSPPLSIPTHLVGCLHLILIIRMGYGHEGILRRVVIASLVRVAADPARAPELLELTRWDPQRDQLQHRETPAIRRALAQRLGLTPAALEQQLQERKAFLEQLDASGLRGAEEVQQRVRTFYQQGLT